MNAARSNAEDAIHPEAASAVDCPPAHGKAAVNQVHGDPAEGGLESFPFIGEPAQWRKVKGADVWIYALWLRSA